MKLCVFCASVVGGDLPVAHNLGLGIGFAGCFALLAEHMKEADVELVLAAALEKNPDCAPRVISDNGPQFTARDFKEYFRVTGMSLVRTSPYYPQK